MTRCEGRADELASKLKGGLFARLDLNYFDHPKIAALSSEAILAHLEMIVYSRKYMTDGVVPMRIAMRFASDVLRELAENDPECPSITISDDGSIVIHDYAEWQETRDEIERRARSARRSAESRWGSGAVRSAKRNAKRNAERSATSNAERNAETETENIYMSDSSGEEPRPDIEAILDHLDAELDRNGLKKPNRTQSNLRAARLLLDRDGRSVDEVKSIIDFAQSSEFWMPNIRSMSKLREKWDTLAAQAGKLKPKAKEAAICTTRPY